MTASGADQPTPDEREPQPCPKCGEVCKHDGWGHVHATGLGIGSCADQPTLRDLAAALRGPA